MRTAEDLLRAKGGGAGKMIRVAPETKIQQALKVMVLHKIGAVLVEDAGEIVGIWTERDLLRNTLAEGFDPWQTKVGEVMSTGLVDVAWDDGVYQLMDKFLGLRLRHLLVEKDGVYIGLLSIGDALKAALQEKSVELEALHSMVSWEYHEEWRWHGQAAAV